MGRKFNFRQTSKNDASKLYLYDYIVACIAALILVPIVSVAGMAISNAMVGATTPDGTTFLFPAIILYLLQYFTIGTFSFLFAWGFILASVLIFPFVVKRFGVGFHVQLICATILMLPLIIDGLQDKAGFINHSPHTSEYLERLISLIPLICMVYTYSTAIWFLCKWRKPAAFRK